MARRTIGFAEVTVTLSGRPDEGAVGLDDVGPEGLHELVAAWAQQYKNITDTERKIYTAVDRAEVYSSAVLMEVATGSWGDDRRKLVNSKNAVATRDIDPDDASTVGTRSLLITPPGGTTALYFSEREGHFVGGSRAWTAIEAEIRAAPRLPDRDFNPRRLVPAKTTAVLGEEWLHDVRLRAVSVTRVRPADTWGTATDEKDLLLEQTLRATGANQLSPRLLRELRKAGSREEVASVFRLDGDDEIKTVNITVTDGDREKTYEYESPGTPPLREILNEHGQPVLNDRQFVDHCAGLAETYYRRVGQTFEYSWTRSTS